MGKGLGEVICLKNGAGCVIIRRKGRRVFFEVDYCKRGGEFFLRWLIAKGAESFFEVAYCKRGGEFF